MALNFFKSFLPIVKAQEEADLVDPQAELKVRKLFAIDPENIFD